MQSGCLSQLVLRQDLGLNLELATLARLAGHQALEIHLLLLITALGQKMHAAMSISLRRCWESTLSSARLPGPSWCI